MMKRILAVLVAVMLTLGVVGAAAYASGSKTVAQSVEQKKVPELAGDLVVKLHIEVVGEENETVYVVPEEDYDIYTCAQLKGESLEMYKKLANADKISDVCANFLEVLAKIDSSLSEDNAIIRDVFEFDLDDNSESYKELVKNAEQENRYIEMPFKYSLKKNQTVVALEVIDGEWVALDPVCVVVKDNVASVRIQVDGVIALCVINK